MSKILICTGIYPPAIGGPAQYAKEVADEFRRQGHMVRVLTYKLEHFLPPLVRHELFFWRTFFTILRMRMRGGKNRKRDSSDNRADNAAERSTGDFILALDTFSVGWPATVAAKILGKKILIRTGGDFLWESYVERMGELVFFRDFYDTFIDKCSLKERFIFRITKWTLQNVSAVIFSTEWQRDIFTKAYGLDPRKNFIVENFYGGKIAQKKDTPGAVAVAVSVDTTATITTTAANQTENNQRKKVFVAGTRPLKWKNLDILKQSFSIASQKDSSLFLDTSTAPYDEFLQKIQNSYAVILASIGDISPNMILDAIRCGKPFILTRENGLTSRLKDIAIFCNPEDAQDIAEKILWLADEKNYVLQQRKVADFNFEHSWREIVHEIMQIVAQITAQAKNVSQRHI